MTDQDNAKALHAELLEQERDVQFDSFGLEDAWQVGSMLRELAAVRQLPVAISIVMGDQRVFHAALPGSAADNDDWLARKFRVVRRFGHASYTVGTEYRARGKRFDDDVHFDVREYAAHGGAFPLRVRGSMVGIVGVSGLPQEDDHALVVEVLTAHRDNATVARD